MEIDIIKRETTGTGPSVYHENDTIAKYEIMDGAPVRGKQHFFTMSASPHSIRINMQFVTMHFILQESPFPFGYSWLVMI